MSIRDLGLADCIVDRTDEVEINMERIREVEVTIMRQIKNTERVAAMSMEPSVEYDEEPRAAISHR